MAAQSRPKLLLLGDSLTQTSLNGWGGGLAHRYQRRADVLNRGMSGYNSRWYMQYAQDSGIWQETGNVVLTTIFFGANDASLAKLNPHHHVPVEEYEENLRLRGIRFYEEQYALGPAFQTEDWKASNRKHRHALTRTTAHGFHHRICQREDFHPPEDHCVCRLCGKKNQPVKSQSVHQVIWGLDK